MPDVRRLLVAIDLHRQGATLTAGSCSATDQAVELVKHLGADVVLLHTIRPDAPVAPGVTPRLADVVRHTLDQVADRFRAIGVSATVEISDETPWLAIVRQVLRERIDLVFAGRRNERSQGVLRLGSVSRRLVRKCPCAVWVAKPRGNLAPRRVLAAVDLSPVGERVIDHAAFVARHYGAELHVAHAYQLRRGAEIERWTGIEPLMRRESHERAQRLSELVERAGGAPSVAVHALRGGPAAEILDLCSRLDPGLVVMGTFSRPGRARTLLLGNTAVQLLGHLECSLLTVKPEAFVCPVTPD